MAVDFQPLHNETHKEVKIGPVQNVADLTEQHALGLVVQEFANASAEFPIFFVKDSSGDQFFPVAMLGIEQGTNLFVTEDSKWDAAYMPARYSHKPLSVIPHQDDGNKFAIAIDMNSPLIADEGSALFDNEGKETEHLEARKKAIMAYIQHEQVTKEFVDMLTKMELIVPRNLKLKVLEKEIALNGLYAVDEKKLNELSDEDFLELRKHNYLAPIYAHLGSIINLNKLLSRQAKRSQDVK